MLLMSAISLSSSSKKLNQTVYRDMVVSISWTYIIVSAICIDTSNAWNGTDQDDTTVQCNATSIGDKGFLVSPNYPKNYPANVLCYFYIQGPAGSHVVLTFPHFNIERSRQCIYDYVQIFDGPTEKNHLLLELCGKNSYDALASTGHQLLLVFTTDESIQTQGFNISYMIVHPNTSLTEPKDTKPDTIVLCNSTSRIDTGFLVSPNYPKQYPTNILCNYRIQGPAGSRVVLTFPYFNVEASPLRSCIYDYVQIFDGLTDKNHLLLELCGKSFAGAVASTGHQVLVVFTTDSNIQTQGFNISYVIVHPTASLPSNTSHTKPKDALPACGRPTVRRHDMVSGRITSGKEAMEGQSPWFVLMLTRNKVRLCGGSLINSEWFVAAAHCVRDFEKIFKIPFSTNVIDIYIGTNQCNGNQGVHRRLKQFIVHPSYHHYHNDIALFQLDQPVVFTDRILPVCLENERIVNESLVDGRFGVVTGCGVRSEKGNKSTSLREVFVPYVNRSVCQKTTAESNMAITSGIICAGYPIANRGDACQGDSGGPFVMKRNGRWILVGVVSWGVGCDREEQYGLYAYVAHYYDWIIATTVENT